MKIETTMLQANDFKFTSLDFLFFGYLRGWIDRNDIVFQAMKALGTEEEFGNLSDVAFSSKLDEIDFRNLLMTYLKNADMELTEIRKKILEDKWKLVVLNDLDITPISDEKKIEKLQEIYAEFGYPPDMAGCSIYSKERIDPLVALKNLLVDLKSRCLSN